MTLAVKWNADLSDIRFLTSAYARDITFMMNQAEECDRIRAIQREEIRAMFAKMMRERFP